MNGIVVSWELFPKVFSDVSYTHLILARWKRNLYHRGKYIIEPVEVILVLDVETPFKIIGVLP